MKNKMSRQAILDAVASLNKKKFTYEDVKFVLKAKDLHLKAGFSRLIKKGEMIEVGYYHYTLNVNEQEPLKFKDKSDITIIKDVDFDINLYDENVGSFFSKPKFYPGTIVEYYDDYRLIEVWEIVPYNNRSVFYEIKAFGEYDTPIAQLDTDNIFESEKDVWYYKIKNCTSEYCEFKIIPESEVEDYIKSTCGRIRIKNCDNERKYIIVCNKNQNHTGFLTSFTVNDLKIFFKNGIKISREVFYFIKIIIYELFHSYFFSKYLAKDYGNQRIAPTMTCFTRNDKKNDVINNQILEEMLGYLFSKLSMYQINGSITTKSFKAFYRDNKIYPREKDVRFFKESGFKLL
jgi:hypothetical protein